MLTRPRGRRHPGIRHAVGADRRRLRRRPGVGDVRVQLRTRPQRSTSWIRPTLVLGPADVELPNGELSDRCRRRRALDRRSTRARRWLGTTPRRDGHPTIELPAGSGPAALAARGDSLWVAAGRQPSVFRIDTADPGRPAERFGTGGDVLTALSVAPDGTAWFVERAADSVLALVRFRRHPSGRRAVGDRLRRTERGRGHRRRAIWISCSNSSNVVRLDPSDGSVVASLDGRRKPGPDGRPTRPERCGSRSGGSPRDRPARPSGATDGRPTMAGRCCRDGLLVRGLRHRRSPRRRAGRSRQRGRHRASQHGGPCLSGVRSASVVHDAAVRAVARVAS